MNLLMPLADADANADAAFTRLAIKKYEQRVMAAMKSQFLEMGMCSIVFTIFTRPDGKLVIDA
jgi:hypothetical protein